MLFVGDDWAEEHHDVEVQGQAEQVVIGIETDRGPWEQALLAAGYRVWAINPLQVARYRERHSVSGAKATPLTRTPRRHGADRPAPATADRRDSEVPKTEHEELLGVLLPMRDEIVEVESPQTGRRFLTPTGLRLS